MIYIIGKVKVCALRICYCFWAWGSFQPVELVLENGLEKWIFWLFSTYMFLESWDQTGNESVGIFRIQDHLRPWEVIKGQSSKSAQFFWLLTLKKKIRCLICGTWGTIIKVPHFEASEGGGLGGLIPRASAPRPGAAAGGLWACACTGCSSKQ